MTLGLALVLVTMSLHMWTRYACYGDNFMVVHMMFQSVIYVTLYAEKMTQNARHKALVLWNTRFSSKTFSRNWVAVRLSNAPRHCTQILKSSPPCLTFLTFSLLGGKNVRPRPSTATLGCTHRCGFQKTKNLIIFLHANGERQRAK